MRILVTNDDGVYAEGIRVLAQHLRTLGEVFVVAPERPRSAAGHSITLHKPLRLHRVHLLDGTIAYATNGTPTDCVTLGAHAVMEHRVDLVVSGINAGPNLGWDLTYSGTVAAAIEGAVHGVNAFAISLAAEEVLPLARSDSDAPAEPPTLHYETAGQAAVQIASMLMEHPLPPHTFLNVNVPNLPWHEVRGFQATALGKRQYADRIETRVDPAGRPYYWLSGSLVEDRDQPGTDVYAVAHGYVSITPIHLDFTAYNLLAPLHEWVAQLNELARR
ncbi:MAG: 5'/3'-nucleotidase SurE [Fimbriimonadales bacterium]|jgi:5'-nucleotidase|nr:5'/3'-nucleotidase SurE [Fimbriimonadales bacterium]GIV12496.1 MAG: 5'-nucleotidase SurE [Fimbriimonadales bacterium]CUU02684.1 5'-nucleotidase /3'-nucleotidase /exopolyphosphatase [Armatimonadetes bacterium GBS]CUU38577.1 5'-nucleotidase /3'-nucleotidase /exopolyphosphatase [Armatimonadetes bacterium GXS]